jgi:hypothetical protein
VKEREKKAKRK